MKKIVLLITVLFFSYNLANAQGGEVNQEATIKYNLFKGDYNSKNYDGAYENWMWCMDNSPRLSENIYKLGIKIAEHRLKKASEADKPAAIALVRRVYDQRIELYPKKLAKVYSDYAGFLVTNKFSDAEIFEKLEKSYKIDPSKMGVKSIFRYFEYITNKNKENNVQLVFDTYDVLLKAVKDKLNYYSTKLDGYSSKEEKGETLSKREQSLKKAYELNSRAIGQVEGGLDKRIVELSTCERLIPMYTRDYEANKTNGAWLASAVNRMYKKECTEDPLYDKLVETYVTVENSPSASVLYAGILLKKNDFTKAQEYFEKAVEQETDAFKKADHLYKIAQIMKKKGRKVEARKYARKAIQNKRSMGKAYLLIATLYAKSANSCGTTEFEKKMVYGAALAMAKKAAAVDPANRRTANKHVKSYESGLPSKKLIFTVGKTSGASYKVGCWINETVKIP